MSNGEASHHLSIQNNTALTDISGLSNIQGRDGQKLMITEWNIYEGMNNIDNDRTKVC